MIKIMADSTAYIPKDYAETNDVTIIPLRYLYKDQEFVEGWPGEFDEFFEDFTKTKIFPKTSQPSLETFTEKFNEAIDNGDEVILYTISSSLSGTNSVANLAKDQCKDPSKVTVMDSQSDVQTIWGYVMESVEMAKQGKSRQEIVERITKLAETSGVSFIPDSLEYLAKGGRIGKITYHIGNLLNIKPIISFLRGKISNKNSFGLQKAIKDMMSAIPEKIKRLFVIHVANTKFFEMLKNVVKDWLDKKPNKDKIEVYEGEVGPVTASHVGPAIGLAWIADVE